MKLSIVTPSFRNTDWLKLCVASVADQQGVTFEHIVQDSCSDDGTQTWLPHDPRVTACIEKDNGMYDAVNRGFRRSQGDILAYLNCDEQYLPGALEAVAAHFRQNPATDIVVADTVVVDGEGKFICCRKSLKPWKNVVWIYNPTITSSIFLHRRVLDEYGLFFDTKWRDLGDLFWMIEAVNRGLKFGVLRRYTSTFADTGENMNLKPNAMRERETKVALMPGWVRRFQWPLFQLHRVRKFIYGAYYEKPFTYSLYTHTRPDQRTSFLVEKPSCVWRERHALMQG
jgi:glycosyltransferase involved in cell wall biosynthesis